MATNPQPKFLELIVLIRSKTLCRLRSNFLDIYDTCLEILTFHEIRVVREFDLTAWLVLALLVWAYQGFKICEYIISKLKILLKILKFAMYEITFWDQQS